MTKKIIFVFALFLTLTGFRGEERIVERSYANALWRAYANGEAPKIDPKLKPVTVHEGETAEFKVSISGSRDLKITWYQGTRVIKADAVFEIFWDGTIAKLVIRNVTKEHAAEYRVEVTNPYGKAVSSAILTVTPKES